MNKIALLLLASLVSLNANAKLLWCDYSDYFHLSTDADPNIVITEANANREIMLQIISPRSFELRDAGNCMAGYAHITYSLDRRNWCTLDIKDGPTLWHPSIKASCSGLKFKSLDYDGDHSYTIRIS